MSRPPTIRYQPALDGVRGVAVVAVLLFHAGAPWMSGGYLGVSVFFTLSGFLITSLLLAESSTTGSIDARAFYARRARRLLPASLVCIAGVCVMSASGLFRGVSGLRRDVVGAVLQVFNWVKLGSGESYADLNNAQAGLRHPLDHYWSLAIEEQFYWIWPVTVLAVLWLCRRKRWLSPTRIVGALFLAFAAAAPLISAIWGPDAAYWATPARAGEILAGAVVACWSAARPALPATPWLAPLCLATLVVAFVAVPDGHGLAYRGGLPLLAVVSAGLIIGLQTTGAVRRLLSLAPIVALGRISYGVYLYHWPVFVLVDRQRWHLPPGATSAIKLGVTGVVAVLSYVLVERPVRRSGWLVPRRTLVAGLTSTALAGALVLIVPGTTPFYRVDGRAAGEAGIVIGPVAPLTPATATTTAATAPIGAAAGEPAPPGSAGAATSASLVAGPPATSTSPVTGPPATSTSPVTTPAPSAPATGPAATDSSGTAAPGTDAPGTAATSEPVPPSTAPLVPPRAVRILVIGDSTAEATGAGLVAWARTHPELAQVSLQVREGCGFVAVGHIPYGSADRDVVRNCGHWLDVVIPAAVAKLQPDVVMLLSTSWDVLDRRLTRAAPVLPITDPAIRPLVVLAMETVTRRVLTSGASRVVWLREPIPDPYWFHDAGGQRDPANHQVLYDEMAALAAADPAVRVVDLAGWIEGAGLGEDTAARPDGVHWSPSTATRIATELVGPALVEAALT